MTCPQIAWSSDGAAHGKKIRRYLHVSWTGISSSTIRTREAWWRKGPRMFRPEDRQKCWQLFEKYYTGRKFHDTLYRDLIRKYLQPGQRLLDAGCRRHLKFCKATPG